ncbi:MAG: hypothetical protein AB7G48_00460 [Nitrospiraceae bacterium]
MRRGLTLKGFLRSPRTIRWASGSHEVRYVPPCLLVRCGRAHGEPRLGAPGWAGEMADFLTILHGILRSSVIPRWGRLSRVLEGVINSLLEPEEA